MGTIIDVDELKSKIVNCKNELLDFSKRNQYLKFRTKSAVEFDRSSWDFIAHHVIVRKTPFKVECPKITNSSTSGALTTYNSLFAVANIEKAVPKCNPDDYKKLFRNLYSKYKLAQSEMGVNVIFICFGLLRYSDRESGNEALGSDEILYAPLLTQPVALTRESIDGPYLVTPDLNEEIMPNLTLEEYLKTKEISLPRYPGNYSQPIDDYLNAVELLAHKYGWEVERRLFIQCLQYQKMAIYNDFNKNQFEILDSPFVSMMFGANDVQTLSYLIPVESVDLDKTVFPENNFDVLDADASQEEAIRNTMDGRSIILQGPPGTGKSQTITNIIANAIAQGKKVLFVAQKKEALDVVYRNLSQCKFSYSKANQTSSEGDLSDFCLYLHNSNTKKKEVMEMIKTAMFLQSGRVDTSKRDELRTLVQKRNALNNIDQCLHQPIMPMGKSLYDCYGFLFKTQSPFEVNFEIPNLTDYTYDRVLGVINEIGSFGQSAGEYSDSIVLENPWYGFICSNGNLLPDGASEKIKKADSYFKEFINAMETTRQDLQLSTLSHCDYNIDNCGKLLSLLPVLASRKNINYHVLMGININTIKKSICDDLEQERKIRNCLETINKLYESSKPLIDILEVKERPPLFEQNNNDLLKQLVVALDYWPTISKIVDRGFDDSNAIEKFRNLRSLKKKEDALKASIKKLYSDEVFSLDSERGWQITAKRGLFPMLNQNYQEAKSQLLRCLKSRKIRFGYQIKKDYKALSDFHFNSNQIISLEETLKNVSPDLFRNHVSDRDLEIVEEKCFDLHKLIDSLKSYSEIEEDYKCRCKKLSEFFYEGIKDEGINAQQINDDLEWAGKVVGLVNDGSINQGTLDYLYGLNDCPKTMSEKQLLLTEASKCCSAAIDIYQSLFFNVGETDLNRLSVSTMADKLNRILNADRSSFSHYAFFYKERETLIDSYKLYSFVEQVTNKHILSLKLSDIFQHSFFYKWIGSQLSNNEALKDIKEFNGLSMKKLVDDFKQIDKLQYTTAPSMVAKALIEKAGSSESVRNDYRENGHGSLRHEVFKQSKVIPTRILLSQYLDDVLLVTPVLMMSPLSVSTYLPKNAKFDMVVFDEASQITPEDAIGSIYRGTQLVIAGDDQQLPPTDFFTSKIGDDDDYDEEDSSSDSSSFGSVLDMFNASALNDNRIMLQWHYRSKDESLIAFSNAKIYGSKLITFPSPQKGNNALGVDFEYVNNGFWLGRGHGNPNEAQKVASYIIKFFKKYGNIKEKTLSRSLGVVAFGVAQADAIEAALDRLLEEPENVEYQIFASDTNAVEPFFIKNLETVQGDQRDVIFLSVGYGKDEKGNHLLRYGPVQADKGYRRLNVAITRAKYKVVVFSSVYGSEIPVERASGNPRGLILLRDYLNYAKCSDKANFLASDSTFSSSSVTESPFEDEVFDFLKENGIKATPQIGCSSYRIDFGIEDPQRPGYYILAVECDGAMYHSAKNARERDRLRQQELESMGWKFYRIWSTDWFSDQASQKRLLLQAIRKAAQEANVSNSVYASPKIT